VLICEAELGIGLVGLGRLTEFVAMTLWADAQARALTAGTGGTLRDIVDTAGARLYPGYFWTHVTVPPERLLERHQVWDRVAVGVDVKTFGPILESTYVLGTPSELAEGAPTTSLPAMRSAAMFFVDGTPGEPQPATPKKGTVNALPKLEKPPSALARFKDVRASGVIDAAQAHRLRLSAPVACPIVTGREIAAGQHALVFAQFVKLFDAAERALLSELEPPTPAELVDHLAVLDRQIFYLDNCGLSSVVMVHARGTIEHCDPKLTGTSDQVAAAVLKLEMTAYEATTLKLLSVAAATKLFVVPWNRPGLLHAAERLSRRYGVTA